MANGYCCIPIAAGPCPFPNTCLNCPPFRTDQTFQPIQERQLTETRKLIQLGVANSGCRWCRKTKSLARAASVSSAWLYQQAALKSHLQQLRSGIASLAQPTKKTPSSADSKAAIVAPLRQRIEKLEEENRALPKQFKVVYGELAQRQG